MNTQKWLRSNLQLSWLSAASGLNWGAWGWASEGASQQGDLAVLLRGPRIPMGGGDAVRAPGLRAAARWEKEKGVEGLIWIWGKVQEQGRVLTWGLRFENSWEQIRSHGRQRVRMGVKEASVNVSECKAWCGCETGPRPGWTGDLEAHSRGLPQE